jgi:hypothetical protein
VRDVRFVNPPKAMNSYLSFDVDVDVGGHG